MRMVYRLLPFILLLGAAAPSSRVQIGAGSFTPLYGLSPSDPPRHISAFAIDAAPVTNHEFAQFLQDHSDWAPGAVAPILTDASYLKHWTELKGRAVPRAGERNRPVTNISWFAASAFCASRGGRLPTTLEWEYVGAASATERNASQNPAFVQELLAWYGRPRSEHGLAEVRRSAPNVWGVFDMHGLIWEWTADFNSVFVAGDNRRDGEQLKNLYCGDSAATSSDRANYAAFMRYALRSSLRGEYTMENLGFRCAYDFKKGS